MATCGIRTEPQRRLDRRATTIASYTTASNGWRRSHSNQQHTRDSSEQRE
jgi:hypothetical protein